MMQFPDKPYISLNIFILIILSGQINCSHLEIVHGKKVTNKTHLYSVNCVTLPD